MKTITDHINTRKATNRYENDYRHLGVCRGRHMILGKKKTIEERERERVEYRRQSFSRGWRDQQWQERERERGTRTKRERRMKREIRYRYRR